MCTYLFKQGRTLEAHLQSHFCFTHRDCPLVLPAGISLEPFTSFSSRRLCVMQLTILVTCPHVTSLVLKQLEPNWGMEPVLVYHVGYDIWQKAMFWFFFHITLMLSPYHGTNAATEQSFTIIIMFSARNMLELGRSQSWTRALETISGDRRMDARPLLDYFEKLHEWLIEENRKYNRTVGWKTETEPCKYEITKEYKHIRCTFAEVLGLSFLNCLFSNWKCFAKTASHALLNLLTEGGKSKIKAH